MSITDTRSALDVAIWFHDQGDYTGQYLSPQKLQRLLFIAQACYGVTWPGRTLMPACFVASALGPLEPNVFHAFSNGRPAIETNPFEVDMVEEFLDTLWRQLSTLDVDTLNGITNETDAYRDALFMGEGSIIPLHGMVESFTPDKESPRAHKQIAFGTSQLPPPPRVLRNQYGKAVLVKPWRPL